MDINLTVEHQQYLFWFAVTGAVIAVLALMQNPAKLRKQTKKSVSMFAPEDRRQEIATLLDALNGRVRITEFQINMLSILGAMAGVVLGGLVWLITADPMVSAGFAVVTTLLMIYLPRQKFVKGYSRAMLEKLESEAPALIGSLQRSIGTAGLSVQVAFEQYCASYPDTTTTELIQAVPPNIGIADGLMSLELPSEEAPSWTNIIQTVANITEYGDPAKTLKSLRESVRLRAEQKVRREIKKKVFSAPATTVILMLPALMGVLLGGAVIQAMTTLSGTSILQ
jgi:hypothetical protein